MGDMEARFLEGVFMDLSIIRIVVVKISGKICAGCNISLDILSALISANVRSFLGPNYELRLKFEPKNKLQHENLNSNLGSILHTQ